MTNPMLAELDEVVDELRRGDCNDHECLAMANRLNRVHATLADMAKRLEEAERDGKRLDALEQMANKPGGILLHDGSESGRCGIGLRPGFATRTLREAIDATQEGEG